MVPAVRNQYLNGIKALKSKLWALFTISCTFIGREGLRPPSLGRAAMAWMLAGISAYFRHDVEDKTTDEDPGGRTRSNQNVEANRTLLL